MNNFVSLAGIDAGLKEEEGNEDAEKDLVEVSELGFLLV
jgi:hypothetical protein